MDERSDERLGKAINEYLNHYVLVVDGKAAAVAAASLVLIGFVVAPEPTSDNSLLKLTGVFLAAVAAAVAGSVLYPRTPHSGSGHMFWSDIRSFESANSYWKSLAALDSDSIGLEYARQNFNVSGVLTQKTRAVRLAIWLFGAACAVLAIAFGER